MKWFVNSVNWVRDLFPFTHEGRQTLVYLMYAWSVPVLTFLTKWILTILSDAKQWALFGQIANKVADALLIGVVGYACFVSIRAIKLGKDGFDVQGRENPDPLPTKVTTTTETKVE